MVGLSAGSTRTTPTSITRAPVFGDRPVVSKSRTATEVSSNRRSKTDMSPPRLGFFARSEQRLANHVLRHCVAVPHREHQPPRPAEIHLDNRVRRVSGGTPGLRERG